MSIRWVNFFTVQSVYQKKKIPLQEYEIRKEKFEQVTMLLKYNSLTTLTHTGIYVDEPSRGILIKLTRNFFLLSYNLLYKCKNKMSNIFQLDLISSGWRF